MNEKISYRLMESGEEAEGCELVIQVFDKFISELYSEEGVREFLRYVKPLLFILRSKANHFVLIAKEQEKIIGMIEVRNYTHIPLFYVHQKFQQKGVGKELLRRALEICLEHKLELLEITVNSSPNAVVIYENLGFVKAGSEQLRNGII
ncbi:MAG: GNAT family N-acetyltransferase, partial [Candidatus Hodarchaeota archaeon]